MQFGEIGTCSTTTTCRFRGRHVTGVGHFYHLPCPYFIDINLDFEFRYEKRGGGEKGNLKLNCVTIDSCVANIDKFTFHIAFT